MSGGIASSVNIPSKESSPSITSMLWEKSEAACGQWEL